MGAASIAACDDDDSVAPDHDDGDHEHGDDHDSGGSAWRSTDFSDFDKALEKAISDYNDSDDGKMLPIHGASAAVVTKDDGVVYTHGYGDFAADRLYLIASSSKLLSVGVLMRLSDQGKLDMDRPVSEYLSDDWGEHKTKVSAAQLVSNSSGLPSLSEIVAAGQDTTSDTAKSYAAHFCQYMPVGSLADCAKGIYEDDQANNNRDPDKEFRYGGSQWQLAGGLAEVVTGKSWANLIKETYVDPCGVSTLGYTNPFGAEGVAPFAYPPFFKADKANAPKTENPSLEGGAYITVPDYAKLLVMHLRDGKCGDTQVLSSDAVARMRRDRVAAYGGDVSGGDSSSPYDGYGLGWWLGEDLAADPGAYGSYPYLDLKRNYGAVIFIEVSSAVGGKLAVEVKPALDAIIDAHAN
jgi:CubicO group peptidase (beta-lactamase class C family)